MGFRKVQSTVGSISQFSNNSIAEQVATREDSIQPIRAANYTAVGPAIEVGSYSTLVPRTSLNSCANLSFKVFRLPCAYGYMQDYYYDNIIRNGNDNITKGKKRVISGKFTNSTAGFTSKGGLYVSRPGTDVTTCELDDLILGTDTGIANVAYRGEEQKLALNYSSVITSTTTIPTVTATVTSSASGSSTQSISFYNPYETIATPAFSATTNIESSYSATQSLNFTDYTFSFSDAGTINFSLHRKISDLAVF